MEGVDRVQFSHRGSQQPFRIEESHFIAAEILQRDDVAERQAKLASIISAEIIPRLLLLQTEAGVEPAGAAHPTEDEVAGLARLVLSADIHAAAAFITALKDAGLSADRLFLELLEPAARCLGTMWERDECDFIDVTLGVGRLQKLLAIFNCTHDLPALVARRRVLVTMTPGEQHFFGMSVVEKFLRAGGWHVHSAPGASIDNIAGVVRSEWFAVAGITLASEAQADTLERTIGEIRRQSRNPAIGIMVGGPAFAANPDLVSRVGADATAASAPTAVILAQKLFDAGALNNWLPAAG